MKKVILREAIAISLMRLIEYNSSFHRRLCWSLLLADLALSTSCSQGSLGE